MLCHMLCHMLLLPHIVSHVVSHDVSHVVSHVAFAAGDDPNYWMALTQQAEAEFMARKVRKMLLDVDKTVAQVLKAGIGIVH